MDSDVGVHRGLRCMRGTGCGGQEGSQVRRTGPSPWETEAVICRRGEAGGEVI